MAHLTTIVVCFEGRPYIRFVHAMYRLLALVADNIEQRRLGDRARGYGRAPSEAWESTCSAWGRPSGAEPDHCEDAAVEVARELRARQPPFRRGTP